LFSAEKLRAEHSDLAKLRNGSRNALSDVQPRRHHSHMSSFTFLRLARLSAILALAIALTSCGETKPSHFYVLSAISPEGPTDSGNPAAKRQGVIAVGPIEMPKYLDRPQIVTFIDSNQLDAADFDRWGEPLANNFARVMAENILLMTSAARVEIYPFPVISRNSSNRQIAVQVIRFHRRSDGVVDLWANWNILDQDGHRILASGMSEATETASAGDFKSVAAAMSRAISSFSKEVADAFNSLPRPAS
jgi:uncharacterized lipoprotein YmbA